MDTKMPVINTSGPSLAISGPLPEMVSMQAADRNQISSQPSLGSPLKLTESPTETKTQTKEGLSEFQSANIRGQVQWEKHMKDVDLQRRYQKVSVMMIHWDMDGEDSVDAVDAQTEIDKLSEVFESTYRFSVCQKKLTQRGGRSAKVQIHKFLADFVYDEDVPGTLLIVYYAGHGTPDSVTGRLLFARGNLPASDEKSEQMNCIVWNEAEQLIHSAQHADIFLILDCCHAGKLLNARMVRQRAPWSDRIFEFLGASGPDQTTPLPGADSFSSALTWALKELAMDGCFMSSELLDKILNAPRFPRGGQLPCLSERGLHSVRRLFLEPLPEASKDNCPVPQRKGEETTNSFEYSLNLQFLLPRIPSDDEIRDMCDGLKELIKSPHFIAKQILWKGLSSKDHSRPQVQRVVREFLLTLENQKLKNRIRTLSNGSALSPVPWAGKQEGYTIFGLPTPAPSNASVEFVDNEELEGEDCDQVITVRSEGRPRGIERDPMPGKWQMRPGTLAFICAIFVAALRSKALRVVMFALLTYYVLCY